MRPLINCSYCVRTDMWSSSHRSATFIWTDLTVSSWESGLIEIVIILPTSTIHSAVVDVLFAVWRKSNLNCNHLLYILCMVIVIVMHCILYITLRKVTYNTAHDHFGQESNSLPLAYTTKPTILPGVDCTGTSGLSTGDADAPCKSSSSVSWTWWRKTRTWHRARSMSLRCSRHVLSAPSLSTCCWSRRHGITISRARPCRDPAREQVLLRRFVTARCTILQSAVLRLHVVWLSVRPWRWWIATT